MRRCLADIGARQRVRRPRRWRQPPRPVRLIRSIPAPATIQTPSRMPIGASAVFSLWMAHPSAASASASSPAGAIARRLRASFARFHGRLDPIGSKMPSATKNGVTARLKNGGPTESFRSKEQLCHQRPDGADENHKASHRQKMLFRTSADSRLPAQRRLWLPERWPGSHKASMRHR